VSQLNHDAEALMVITEKLSRRGFTTIPIEAAKLGRDLRLSWGLLCATAN